MSKITTITTEFINEFTPCVMQINKYSIKYIEYIQAKIVYYRKLNIPIASDIEYKLIQALMHTIKANCVVADKTKSLNPSMNILDTCTYKDVKELSSISNGIIADYFKMYDKLCEFNEYSNKLLSKFKARLYMLYDEACASLNYGDGKFAKEFDEFNLIFNSICLRFKEVSYWIGEFGNKLDQFANDTSK